MMPEMEFQAVVMAAGRGSRMTELTSCICKPLLPVGNKPMILYPLNMLEKAGFEEVIVVVLKSSLADVKRVLEEQHSVSVRIDYFTVDDEQDSSDAGTADTLLQMRDKITSDALVVSCDLIVDASAAESLHRLADIYRMHDATVAMLITPSFNFTDGAMACPGGKSRRRIEKDFIGVDRCGRRVLLLSADSDVDRLSLRISQLKRFPFMEIHSQLSDAHLYFLKKSVLDVIAAEPGSLKTIKGDLIPHLVRQQFAKREQTPARECQSVEDYYFTRRDEHMVCCCMATSSQASQYIRANTLVTYCEANRQTAQRLSQSADGQKTTPTPNRYTASDSLIGTNVTVGDKTNVKGSVVGDQCVLGAKVKLTNCVVMDHVNIAQGANLVGCIVCPNAQVGAGAELRDCLIGSSQHVAGKHNSELLLEKDRSMMEI